MGFDANHPVAIKRAPSAFAVFLCHAEVTAADDGWIFRGMASAFDFAGVARVELESTKGAVSLDEAHGDDRGAGAENERADGFGFVHGKRGGGEALASLHYDCAFCCSCPPFGLLALLIGTMLRIVPSEHLVFLWSLEAFQEEL